MKDQYVILTGSKNNAGDFLIKYRAKKLLESFKPSRSIVDYNAWEAFDEEQLQSVNNSRALILLGGPSLQKNMRPSIYKMRENLEDIKVPIITMGIGWKSISGDWNDTYNYSLSQESIELLERINESGYYSSVRDYHTLNSIRFKGFDNFVMTGCPAYYDLESINKSVPVPKVEKVAFSLGVSFIHSFSMEKLMKDNILKLRDTFADKEFEVVFHHSLSKEKFLATHGSTILHNKRHNEMADWLSQHSIKYVDISGSAEKLMNYYSRVDLHVGYRVHAHIFMNSLSKFSILISEDGRSKATKDVIGGIVLDGFLGFKNDLLSRVLNKFLPNFDKYHSNHFVTKEVLKNIEYEKSMEYIRLRNSRSQIDNNLLVMQHFIGQLP